MGSKMAVKMIVELSVGSSFTFLRKIGTKAPSIPAKTMLIVSDAKTRIPIM
jgi:hypothetical protein